MMKRFSFLTGFLAVFMMAVSFTSCGDDDENEPQSVYTAQAEINYKIGSMKNIADITLEYYDENGKLQSIPMEGNFSRKITYTKLPAKVGFRVIPVPKSSLPEAEDYDINYEVAITVYALKDGEIMNWKDFKLRMDANMMAVYVQNELQRTYTDKYFATVDGEGTITESE